MKLFNFQSISPTNPLVSRPAVWECKDENTRDSHSGNIYTPEELTLAAKFSEILGNISQKKYAPEEIQDFLDALDTVENPQTPMSDFDVETMTYCITGWWVLKNLKSQNEEESSENKSPVSLEHGTCPDSVFVE